MTWIYDGLVVADKKGNYSDFELFRRILKRFMPFKKSIIIITLMILTSTFFNLSSNVIFGIMIDSILDLSGIVLWILVITAGSYFSLRLFGWLINYIILTNIGKFIPEFATTLSFDIFDALQTQDMKFFDKHRSGGLTTRVSADIGAYVGAVSSLLNTLGRIATIGFVFAILVLINVQLALMTLIIIPIIIVLSYFFRKVARKTTKTLMRNQAACNATIAELVNGIHVSKSLGIEIESFKDFKRINQKHSSAGFRQSTSMFMFFPILSIINGSATIIIFVFGGHAVIQNLGFISAGELYIFLTLLNYFFAPLTQFVNMYATIQAGFSSFERVIELIDNKPEIQDIGKVQIEDLEGKIDFLNVDFGYSPNNPVLTNFSLNINPGENIALVGHTGAGKSSIISLIARFYEFQRGKILIDGKDIRKLKLKSYRKHLGMVFQTPHLFNGTIKENIKYGRRDASKADLKRVLEISRVDEILEYLKKGLRTQVGESGALLSTGQRQLVNFARALLANPRILILDEATSAVDAYTESVIQESLEELMKGRTSIIIAHRLSTVKSADRIIVLDRGKIIEEGTHENLLSKNGEYATLYNTYFKHQEVEWRPKKLTPQKT